MVRIENEEIYTLHCSDIVFNVLLVSFVANHVFLAAGYCLQLAYNESMQEPCILGKNTDQVLG